ncbi:MAG: hypothetical protein KBF28_02675 [Gemmatimonadales bacterium]|nr:hypothetical protein [Gemmatimonadales bacterium]
MLRPYILSIMLAACAGAADDAAGGLATGNTTPLAPVVRDSAGVAIYEHPADAFDRAPRFVMSEKPVTEVKGSDFEIDLTRVRQPLLLVDGRIAFYAEGSVVVVSPDGELAERIGREGEGPGEFQYGQLFRGLADTLLFDDWGTRRLSFVVPGRGVVRTRPTPAMARDDSFGLVGQFTNNGLLYATTGFAQTPDLAKHPVIQWRVARLDPGTDSVVRVDSVPGPELALREGWPDIVRNTAIPVSIAWEADFLVSGARHWVLHRIRHDGKLICTIHVAVPRRATEPVGIRAELDEQFSQLMAAYASGRMEGRRPDSATARKRLAEAPRADSLPLIAKAFIGPDGVAWIKDGGYMYAEPTWAWTAVQKDGTILGRLVGTGNDPVVAFGAGRVMLKSEDEDGFVTFRVHTLTVNR